jgi:hypothetical protein
MLTASESALDPRPRRVIRPMRDLDTGYIAKAWVGSFFASYISYKQIEPRIFEAHCYPRVEVILKRAKVRVMVPPSDEATLYGFAVLEPDVIHFVYVLQPWRRMGLSAELLAGIDVNGCERGTETLDWFRWIRHKYPMRGYRPFWMEKL